MNDRKGAKQRSSCCAPRCTMLSLFFFFGVAYVRVCPQSLVAHRVVLSTSATDTSAMHRTLLFFVVVVVCVLLFRTDARQRTREKER